MAVTFLGSVGVIVSSMFLAPRLPGASINNPDSIALLALALGGVVGLLQWSVLRIHVKGTAFWVGWLVVVSLLGAVTGTVLWGHNEVLAVVSSGAVVFALHWLGLRRRVKNAISVSLGTLACVAICSSLPLMLFVFFYPG
jgi:hypothetical protein